MCNSKTSGRTYKIIAVQKAKTCSGYKCTTMGSTQKSSAYKTWEKVNAIGIFLSMLKLLRNLYSGGCMLVHEGYLSKWNES